LILNIYPVLVLWANFMPRLRCLSPFYLRDFSRVLGLPIATKTKAVRVPICAGCGSPATMFAMHLRPTRPARTILSACILLSFMLFSAPNSQSDTRPLPQDQGAVHLYQLLAKLKTTARIMQVVAHPDDEDGGMMTLEARGHRATALLFTGTRGAGGQNKFGAESSDELGILRTLQLLEADKYYGVAHGFLPRERFGFAET